MSARAIAAIVLLAGAAAAAATAAATAAAARAAASTAAAIAGEPSRPAAPATPALQPVPTVDTKVMEPAVREQVDAAQRSLAGAPALPAADAATRFGEAGKTFLLYSLFEAALPCFENAAALAPEDFHWAYYAGVAARQRADLERARGHFQRALALQSPFPAALLRLGELEVLRHDLASAESAYTAALAFPGAAAAAHYGLGRVALLRGDARLAVEHFEATLAAQPAASIVHAQLATAYRRLGQLDKAEAQAAARGEAVVKFTDVLMSEVERANAGNTIRIQAAILAAQEGRFAEAAAGFRQAVAVNPREVRAWLGLGHAQERLGDTAAAERSYRQAVEIDPENPRPHLKLGTLLAQKGALEEGIGQLQTAVRLRPDQAEARFNLATALAQTGRLAEAEAECDALLRNAPQDRDARALRDRLHADLVKQQPGKATPPPPR